MRARRETPIDRDQFALWPLFVDNSRFVRLELFRSGALPAMIQRAAGECDPAIRIEFSLGERPGGFLSAMPPFPRSSSSGGNPPAKL